MSSQSNDGVAGSKPATPYWTETRRKMVWGYIFVTPAVLFFAVFAIFPIVFGTYLSLTSYNLLTPPRFIGFGNYFSLVSDPRFLLALRNTLVFVVGATIPVWIASFFLALLFDRGFRAQNFLKTIYFTPILPPLIVVAVIWKVLLHPNGTMTGLVGGFFGLTEIRWLTDPVLSPLMMIVVNGWATIPFFSMIWLAGMAGIPDEIRHAATLDGASGRQTAFYVVFPMLKNTFVIVAALSTIHAFQTFILQYEMTPGQGGPGDANLTLGLLVLKYGFEYFRMGDAAAISVMLFLIILAITAVQLRLGRQTW